MEWAETMAVCHLVHCIFQESSGACVLYTGHILVHHHDQSEDEVRREHQHCEDGLSIAMVYWGSHGGEDK